MTPTRPPKLAIAVLRRFSVPDDALTGDLLEGFRAGHSRAWLWWQVLAAVTYAALRDLRLHPVVAFRGLVTASMLTWFWTSNWYRIANFDEFLFVTGLFKWFYLNGYGVPAALQSPLGVLAFGWLLSGWVTARLHRPNSTAIVLLCVVVIVARTTAAYVELLVRYPDDVVTIIEIYGTRLAIYALPFLVGGLAGVGRRAPRVSPLQT